MSFCLVAVLQLGLPSKVYDWRQLCAIDDFVFWTRLNDVTMLNRWTDFQSSFSCQNIKDSRASMGEDIAPGSWDSNRSAFGSVDANGLEVCQGSEREVRCQGQGPGADADSMAKKRVIRISENRCE